MSKEYRDKTYSDPRRQKQRDQLYQILREELYRKRGMKDKDRVRVLNLLIHKIREKKL